MAVIGVLVVCSVCMRLVLYNQAFVKPFFHYSETDLHQVLRGLKPVQKIIKPMVCHWVTNLPSFSHHWKRLCTNRLANRDTSWSLVVQI